jgi:hypothetical protein
LERGDRRRQGIGSRGVRLIGALRAGLMIRIRRRPDRKPIDPRRELTQCLLLGQLERMQVPDPFLYAMQGIGEAADIAGRGLRDHHL